MSLVLSYMIVLLSFIEYSAGREKCCHGGYQNGYVYKKNVSSTTAYPGGYGNQMHDEAPVIVAIIIGTTCLFCITCIYCMYKTYWRCFHKGYDSDDEEEYIQDGEMESV